MQRRQRSLPDVWLVADERGGAAEEVLRLARRLPSGTGVLFLFHQLPDPQRRRVLDRLRRVASRRALTVIDEAPGGGLRVHGPREIARAQLRRVRLLFLSPVFRTRSHPDWKPLPRMRTAALLRLARVPVIALGGMDPRRFRQVQALGFHGWAGIDAWEERPRNSARPRTIT